MINVFKKTIGVCLMGLRTRNITGAFFTYIRLVIFNRSSCISSWNIMVMLLKNIRRVIKMQIVVCKVPKFLRGFVKFIFKIKDDK